MANKKKIKKVSVSNISKVFSIGYKENDNILANLISFVSGRETKRSLRVIDNISLDAYAGENIGIIGRNGSGKSTLLRLIAGIYKCDSGEIKTNGEMLYIDGYGLGLKQKLTMKDNIYLVGLLMNLSRHEIKARFEKIVAFSELEEFVNTKTYQFSSGMLSRLSFSISIHCLEHKNPDILLLDEVFGGSGDLSFQEKAKKKMEDFIKGGATVIMVSHDLNTIQKHCDKVILLSQGKVIREGRADTVIAKYRELIQKPKA